MRFLHIHTVVAGEPLQDKLGEPTGLFVCAPAGQTGQRQLRQPILQFNFDAIQHVNLLNQGKGRAL
ncbi:hypothetical protein D3C79_979090 [compost metagenome]